MSSSNDVTALLQDWRSGDATARDRLVSLVYGELRRRAAAHLRRERRNVTLQPTALVHEVWLRLLDQRQAAYENRSHFLAIASQTMRRLLVDRERARRAARRGGAEARVTLAEGDGRVAPPDVDVLDLDRALHRLAGFDPRRARMAELRFFAGLTLEEAAEAMELSRATAERDWQAARAWLWSALREGPA